VKKALFASPLLLVFLLTGPMAASEESLQQANTTTALAPTSTCWYTCFSFNPPGVTNYKIFHVTKEDCCSYAVVSCPPGATPSHPAWGEPALSCGPVDGGP